MKSLPGGNMFWEFDVGSFAFQPHTFLITTVMCTGFLTVSSCGEGLTISQLPGEPMKHYEQGPYSVELNWLSS